MPAQAPSQLSDRRPDSMPPDLWLPDEGCTAGVQWPQADHAGAAQQHAAAPAEDDDGGLGSVLAAVCGNAAVAVSTAQQGAEESTVVWEAEAALDRLPAKVRVPAQEPITLPPWGSRAAARPPAQQPLGENSLHKLAKHATISLLWRVSSRCFGYSCDVMLI